MPFTQINTTNIQPNTVVDFATYSTLSGSLAPKITTVNVANSAFSVLDDTAVNIGGGYIVVTGENFATDATVLVDTTQASAVTRVSSTQLRVQLPAKSAATYNLYVVNPDGGTGIRVNGVTYSSNPNWVTSSPLSNQVSGVAFNVTLSATGATSYAVAAGSTLPTGTTLAANGYFYGTVTVGLQTTYSFDVVATDAENQDASKTFQVTVSIVSPGLFVFGNQAFGQLGLNDGVSRSSPTQIGSATNWNKLGAGNGCFYGIKTDGTLWAWGFNASGQLGRNFAQADLLAASSPVQVGSGTDWAHINNGGSTVLSAIKTNGTLWMWGYNFSNLYLGGITGYRSSPVQLGSNTNWLRSYTNYASAAIKTDGTLWSWGNNNYGQLGQNDAVLRSSPTQVGTDTNWSIIGNANGNMLGIKTNGTLWSWGNNNYGQLGGNNTVYRSSPVQVGSGTDWSDVVTTSSGPAIYALKTNGTIWSWGRNVNGNLGQNDATHRSSPTQIGSLTGWTKIAPAAQGSHAGAIRNGALWLWGNNAYGQLGQNNAILRSSPVQVGSGTGWADVILSSQATLVD